ncbi:hypothetical protein ARMGADRAFT_1071339 [Armillaria gallica]|uniref:Uncharacterized protein n=1 Tax=Armillaria gallica TaxID=47427 RepID=A0A2H3E315_ARMGA|nr:hypothetical protein ARMGADRAFT_1071339 [Armillaria gallica]
METDTDAKIIAISLGIPSATFLITALIIAIKVWYCPYRPRRRRVRCEDPTVTTTTTPTNDPDGIPLEQLPPRIVAPVLRYVIPIHNLTRVDDEEEVMGEPANPQRRTPTPPRRHTPAINLSPTNTPSPIYALNPTPSPLAGISSRDFWDNVTIPYSAYFPSPRNGSPDHRTPPPAGYSHYTHWDQPVQNRELTPEPVRVKAPVEAPIKAPIASTSAHLYPAPCSDWWNIRSPTRSPHRPPQASRWEQLAQQLRNQQQPEQSLPGTGHGVQTNDPPSDSSTAIDPPCPLTPFPGR